ncbi:MAG: AAA family ATPase [Lapillicoccus sp.]
MSARFGHGLVIGTFYPLHAGHIALGRAALSQCDRVTLEVLGGSSESIPVPLRAQWLEEELPMARIVTIIDDAEIDFDSVAAWDHHTGVIRSLLDPSDGPVEAVFTSDAYGQELARRLGAEWVQVDPGRATLPVSSTGVRSDVPGYWWALPAPVRQHLAKRVVVLGAESAATSTLASDLAAHYGVPCVPAYGRTLTARGPTGNESLWQRGDAALIATEQARQADDFARRSPRPLVVCDTDALATWLEHSVGDRSAPVEVLARTQVAALYLLCGDEATVAPVGGHSPGHLRPGMTGRFREVLKLQPAPWIEVLGTREARLATGVRAVEEVLAAGWGLTPSLEQQQAARRAADGPSAPATSA